MFDLFLVGLENVLQVPTLVAVFIGVTLGIIIGALPGLSATMGVALLLPITFGMDAAIGLAMLAAVYTGAMFGGSISAILLRTPGTPAAAATTLDGYPLAKQGLAGKALGASLVAGVTGGIVSTIVLMLFAPPLARFALSFGPPEYFAMAIFGLTLVGSLSEGSLIKGLISAALGLMIAMVGMEMITGYPRYVFEQQNLLGGFSFVAVAIGLFSISQALRLAEKKERPGEKTERLKVSGRVMPSLSELRGWGRLLLQSSAVGTVVGAVPGTGGDIASWVAYNEAKRFSKTKETFGKGNIEGVVAPECANNAVIGGALMPMLALGVPGSAVTAVMIGGLLVHGIRPGPTLMTEYGELTYTLIVSLFFANIVLLVMGYIFSKMSFGATLVPGRVMSPAIVALCVIGTYAINNSLFDVGVMFAFGLLGYVMEKNDFPLAPLILGVILGPMADNALFQTLLISQGSWAIFVTRPLSMGMITLSVISIVYSAVRSLRGRHRVTQVHMEQHP